MESAFFAILFGYIELKEKRVNVFTTQYNHNRLLGSVISLNMNSEGVPYGSSRRDYQKGLVETLELYSDQGLFRKTIFRLTSCADSMPLFPFEWIFRSVEHLYFANDSRPVVRLGIYFWKTSVALLLNSLNKAPEWDSNGCSLRYLIQGRNRVLCHILLNEACEFYLVKAGLPLLDCDPDFRETNRIHRLSVQVPKLFLRHLEHVASENQSDMRQIQHLFRAS